MVRAVQTSGVVTLQNAYANIIPFPIRFFQVEAAEEEEEVAEEVAAEMLPRQRRKQKRKLKRHHQQ